MSNKFKHTQTERAYRTIKQAILKGELPEGGFLSEVEVMKRYGIGRTPFREACNRLHHEELVEVVPRRGFQVAPMSFMHVRDLFEARLLVEGIIAKLAAERAHSDQIDELEQLAERVGVVEDSSDGCERLIQANSAFHLCLARMTQNAELVKIINKILERNERFCYVEYRNRRFRWTELAADHRPIVEAMQKRDVCAVREAVIKDITQAQQATFGQETHAEAQQVLPIQTQVSPNGMSGLES
jgi:DNA-binding GntR family transcriptional regulator